MTEWKVVKLSEIGEIVGGATPSTSREDYYNGDIPWITPKDLAGYSGRYIKRGERNITKAGFDSCSTKIMPKNTILFSSRAPIGYIAIAENDICTNQGFKSIVPNDNINYLFLYYLLKYNKDKIESLGSGTTFKEVSGTTMKNIKVKIPVSKEIQEKIASILDCIDSKIELNQQINNNLEEQAQAIFKQMFTENVESEKWKIGVLGDIADITMGQSPKGSSYNEDNIGTVFFQGRAEFGYRFPTIRLYTTEPKKMAKNNDVLMSVRAPVGDINVAHEDCCIGRGLAAIHSKDNHQSFVLYTMYSLKKQLNVFNGEGTVFGSINKDALNSLLVSIPPIEYINKFEDIVSPMDKMIRNNYNEIQRLTNILDILLPKLMNGEIDINGI